MKIAVATDSGSTISRHFGRAPYYLVFTIEAGQIVGKEQRAKPGHQQFAQEQHDDLIHEGGQEEGHGLGAHSVDKHSPMIEPIRDCDAVIVGGMGTGSYRALEQANIQPFITELADAEAAARAYSDGTLVNHPEWLH